MLIAGNFSPPPVPCGSGSFVIRFPSRSNRSVTWAFSSVTAVGLLPAASPIGDTSAFTVPVTIG